ncbi:DALR anticodon-binding domain-containing protein 3-like isoform X1 [Acropora palmata]|uniref:DALR anticodon-binding domain-containing protein 3-like isoform X1 n=2 Tax=Acropora palmata TaxID=6131 RepID=UPI003DA131C7
MAELFENHCDLLWSLKRSITESFKAIEGIREKRITLKWNKKLSIADIVIPAFTRICFTDPSSIGEDPGTQAIVEDILNCLLKIKFIKHCELASNGHLLLKLDRTSVSRAVVKTVVNKGNQFGAVSAENSASAIMNFSLVWTSYGGDQENLNLDQMRTVLVGEHAWKLLQAYGLSVTSLPCMHNSQFQPGSGHDLIFSSKIEPWTNKNVVEKMKELDKMLKTCKYVRQDDLANSSKSEGSQGKQGTSDAQSGGFGCELECCSENMFFDLEEFQTEPNQIAQIEAKKVPLCFSLIKDVAKLELAVNKVSSTDMLIHVTSCRKTFSQKQVCLVWNFVAENPPAKKQVFFTHGLVTLYKDGAKVHNKLDAMDLLRVRESQLRESYVLKYGDKVEGHGWEASIKQMALSVVKLEVLSISPNSEVKIDLCETSREFRQATFVLYNCARLSKLFQNFDENVKNGVYPQLPPVDEVDFSLLREEDEWELLISFIATFPTIVKDTVPTLAATSQSFVIHTNKICCFLFSLSHKFSSYYGRVHILGESRTHLFPTMFARLYLMKALQQIFQNCLELLNVSYLTQM